MEPANLTCPEMTVGTLGSLRIPVMREAVAGHQRRVMRIVFIQHHMISIIIVNSVTETVLGVMEGDEDLSAGQLAQSEELSTTQQEQLIPPEEATVPSENSKSRTTQEQTVLSEEPPTTQEELIPSEEPAIPSQEQVAPSEEPPTAQERPATPSSEQITPSEELSTAQEEPAVPHRGDEQEPSTPIAHSVDDEESGP